MSETGILEAIWLKRMKLGPMDAKTDAQLLAGTGLAGNANQGGRRQVTIIEKEVFDILKQTLSDKIEPSMRRANLMVSGIRLADSRGRVLQIGACRIHIMGETLPCERMNQAYPGLREALKPNWGGGVYGVVLDDGGIRVGDAVRWVDGAARSG